MNLDKTMRIQIYCFWRNLSSASFCCIPLAKYFVFSTVRGGHWPYSSPEPIVSPSRRGLDAGILVCRSALISFPDPTCAWPWEVWVRNYISLKETSQQSHHSSRLAKTKKIQVKYSLSLSSLSSIATPNFQSVDFNLPRDHPERVDS